MSRQPAALRYSWIRGDVRTSEVFEHCV